MFANVKYEFALIGVYIFIMLYYFRSVATVCIVT